MLPWCFVHCLSLISRGVTGFVRSFVFQVSFSLVRPFGPEGPEGPEGQGPRLRWTLESDSLGSNPDFATS